MEGRADDGGEDVTMVVCQSGYIDDIDEDLSPLTLEASGGACSLLFLQQVHLAQMIDSFAMLASGHDGCGDWVHVAHGLTIHSN